jgi:hypothetical protein
MKKFSTATLVLALACAFGSATATPAPQRCAFLVNAPDQHVVVRGDTLWDISGKFLENPWCWPKVWGMNREQIRDPHWIYPGQVVYFDRVAGRLSLGKPVGGAADVRLSPHIRTEMLGMDAIPAIPASVIEPFLLQPLIITENEFRDAPRIVATQEGRVFLGQNDKAYVRGDLKGGTAFQAFRPGKPLKDPVTKELLGYEAAYLGSLKLQRQSPDDAEAHTLIVNSSAEEMGVGDRLIPVPSTPMLNYVPHAPEQQIDARVVSIYGGVTHAGQNQIITINRGKEDGIDLGTVLRLSRFGQIVPDPTDNKKPVKLPDEEYGTVFMFRVFDRISYGLIMQVTDAVQVGDVAKSPD